MQRTAVLLLAAVMSLTLGGAALAAGTGASPFGAATVGPKAGQKVLLASNQWLNPAGTRAVTNNGGKMVSSTVSPDGTKLAALTWNYFTGFLSIIDLKTHKIVQTVGTYPSYLGDGSVAADGPYYSPDGKTLWLGQATDMVRFPVKSDGTVGTPIVIKLPVTGPGNGALPSGMVLSADGKKLYVAFNGYNTLGVIDTATNTLVNQIPVGVAPRQVVIVGNNAYVSNEGGIPVGNGNNHIYVNWSNQSPVVADSRTGAAFTGTVSVVNLATQAETQEISVGLEPSAEYVAPGTTTLFVANSNSDSVSVIDTSTNKVENVFATNPVPGTSVGSNPNAILMPDSHHLLVSIGRDNALAVYSYLGATMPIRYQGLLPTDSYPVAVSGDSTTGELVVTNDRGIGTFGPESTIDKGPGTKPATGHNTYDDTSTLTVFNWSAALSNIAKYTAQVFTNNNWNRLPPAAPVHQKHLRAVPLPKVIGQPSTIKHVFLVIRENRTYDQVFGDVKRGNGDPADAQFGARVTPNAHALANRFGLYDNYYDPSTLSADGHNWILQAGANDYIEKEFGAFWRSYPSEGADALAYQPNGTLFNQAEAAGKSVQDFGEYLQYSNINQVPAPTWSQWYRDALVLEGKVKGPLPVPQSAYTSWSDLIAVNKVVDPYFQTFDLGVPDQYRLDVWLQAFRQNLRTGNLPQLTIMTLPSDHTGGPVTPRAMVADNDLALGRLVDKVSHSKFWKSSAIFVTEDDAQNGVDHVDGHRSPGFVISPWSKPGALISTYYTQLNMVKTIEQILGLHPMNQMDRAAQPMTNAFTTKPSYRTYSYVPNKIPLTEGLASGSSRILAAVPKSERAVYHQWMAWTKYQHFTGRHAAPDMAPSQQLNRFDWYSAHNWSVPYPGDKKILSPSQVSLPNYLWAKWARAHS